MRHDYDLPNDWHARTDEEKSRWMTQDRARRQALSQQTPYREHARRTAEREARKRSAHPMTAPVKR
jgi:predicted Fe-S protein YdhL (DUF1289 family)